MLVIQRNLQNRRQDDDGAVLVTVVVVMLVGFVVAAMVAASVLFTIQANAENTDVTQAFISAESGRDAAVAELSGACDQTDFSGSNPEFVSSIYVAEGTEPESAEGLSEGCPTEDTDYVVVRSTGTADGVSTTIDSVYPWEKTFEQQAGGVLAYFAGGVTSTVSNYTGDLVVRSGNYTCNNEGTINGDLYVVEGNLSLSRDCTINGSAYVFGTATSNSQSAEITGLLKTGGDVDFTSNGSIIGSPPVAPATVGTGGIESDGDIDLTGNAGTGRVYGPIKTSGTFTKTTRWTVEGAPEQGAVIPPFDPKLEVIRALTAWIDLDGSSLWNATPPTQNACTMTPSQLSTILSSASATKTIIDYRACTNFGNSVGITINPVTVRRDVVFLVPASKQMDLQFSGTVGGTNQLVFIHEDGNRDDRLNGETKPTCVSTIGNDKLNIPSSASVSPKLMIYTPCGMTGNVRAAFSGQLYTNESSINFGNGASYTCATMSWPDAFEKLGCKLKGEGEDVVLETVLVQRLGGLTYQSETQ
ncbi:hypothetical protein [Microbacterium sp. HJ5]